MTGDGGDLRGWSGLQSTSVIRLPSQGLSVSADWQLLAEKQNTVPVYAKYVHMCIHICTHTHEDINMHTQQTCIHA